MASYPKFISKDLVPIQPMSGPSGLNYALKSLYGDIELEEYNLSDFYIEKRFTYDMIKKFLIDEIPKSYSQGFYYFKQSGIPILKTIAVKFDYGGMVTDFSEINNIEADEWFIGWAFKKQKNIKTNKSEFLELENYKKNYLGK